MVDAPTLAALGAPIVRPPFLAYLDVVGDPVRATTWRNSIKPAGTGDPDLDGQTFDAVNPQFVDIGPVTLATGGADQLTVSLSGIVGPDSALLDLLGDQTKWKGRLARLWFMLLDDGDAPIGGVFAFYTGRMMSMRIEGKPTGQTVVVTIESYLASLTSASNRSYLSQGDFDGNDSSAALSIALANNATASAATAGIAMGGGSGGGGGGVIANNYRLD